MIRLTLTALLLGAVAAAVTVQAHNRPALQQTAEVRPTSAGTKSSAALAGPDRIILSPQQRKEASAIGGFTGQPLSLLRVDQPMQYGEFLWNERGVPAGRVSIRVDLRTQVISIFRAGHEIGTAIMLYGADKKETPLGRFPILWKGKNHRSSIYDAPMPYTLRLTGDGVAIHGSNVRWGAATHGCVGVPTAFAARLFAQAKVGDPVVIVRSTPAAQTKAAAAT